MSEEIINKYPSKKQIISVVGQFIISMLVICPLSFINKYLNWGWLDFVSKVTFAILPFWLINREKIRYEQNSFRLTSPRVGVWIYPLVFIASLTMIIGLKIPLNNLIPMSDYFRNFFIANMGHVNTATFILVVILAPVFEELIFRGIVLDGLLHNSKPVTAILLSALLFGLIHMNPWQFVSAFISGIFTGWIYFKTRDIYICIFAHFCNNGIAFLTNVLSVNTKDDVDLLKILSAHFDSVYVISLSLLVLILTIVLLQMGFKKREILID